MIDLENAKKEFLKYVDKFDINEFGIKSKKEHSIRVMECSQRLAEALELNHHDVKLATLIGLLHDIGRFEQSRLYKTFDDYAGMDHADYGVEVLKNNDYIKKYIDNKEDIEILYNAIKNHNKYEIQKGLTNRQELFAKIIKDADKTVIIYQAVHKNWVGQEKQIEEGILNQDLLQQLKKHKLIKLKKGDKDFLINNLLITLGFVFDIYFKYTFEVLKKEDYINKILSRFDFKDEYTKSEIENLRTDINKYITNKVND